MNDAKLRSNVINQFMYAGFDVLEMHNMIRSWRELPALTWDEGLAKAAQSWAEVCAYTGSGAPGESIASGEAGWSQVLNDWAATPVIAQADFVQSFTMYGFGVQLPINVAIFVPQAYATNVNTVLGTEAR